MESKIFFSWLEWAIDSRKKQGEQQKKDTGRAKEKWPQNISVPYLKLTAKAPEK